MENKNQFRNWLKGKGYQNSSIDKYSNQANKKILKEINVDFYEIENLDELAVLLLDVRELEKYMSKSPNRMYSAAISNYIKFKSEFIDLLDTKEDINYGSDIEAIIVTKEDRLPRYNNQPQPPSKLIKGKTTQFKRNSQVGADAIILANYKCQINPNHKFFISRRTNKNYVEAHHLIPIAYQALFTNGIDVVENISALCPVCHRLIHYGVNEERNLLINQLHTTFENRLSVVGIEIKKKDLLELYQIYS
ncbi:MAG: HNH endonuclease [Streptococcaceae bacterium]|nr:HNH endonuclease [Streptococcaceae bacterium]